MSYKCIVTFNIVSRQLLTNTTLATILTDIHLNSALFTRILAVFKSSLYERSVYTDPHILSHSVHNYILHQQHHELLRFLHIESFTYLPKMYPSSKTCMLHTSVKIETRLALDSHWWNLNLICKHNIDPHERLTLAMLFCPWNCLVTDGEYFTVQIFLQF